MQKFKTFSKRLVNKSLPKSSKSSFLLEIGMVCSTVLMAYSVLKELLNQEVLYTSLAGSLGILQFLKSKEESPSTE